MLNIIKSVARLLGLKIKPCATAEIKLGKYRHYKGKEYEVIGVAKHSENMEEFVVYRALYGNGQLWVRPREMFLEEITVEGRRKLRFEYLEQ